MLNTHSAYSLRYGTVTIRELLRILKEKGYSVAALTDINNTSACIDFVRIAPEYGIRPVLGIDFRNGAHQHFVGLACNNEGYKNLNDYLAFHLHQQLPVPQRAVPMPHTCIVYPFRLFPEHIPLEENEYIGVSIADITRLRRSPWLRHPGKLVILQSFTFRHRRDFNVHRLLRAIDNNTLLSKLPKSEEGNESDCFLNRDELYAAFREFPGIIRNTEELLERCCIDFGFGEEQKNRNQKTFSGTVEGDREMVRNLCRDALAYRYPNPGKHILERVDKELEVIEQKGFLSYFLINWDLVHYARSKGYFYVGRGSGANSIVAYLLRITDVDPIELDLYFERFINLYRQNPPDFDIDFSWTDREDITRYIFDRYPNVALVGTYNTFQERAVVRELGKVFGLPGHEIETLSGDRAIKTDRLGQLVLHYGKWMQGLPSQLSIHASGVLISEAPIHQYGCTFLPPKGYPTTQFDMVVAEDIGLYKFDILSQRGLGKIKDTLQLVKLNRPQDAPVDIHDVARFKRDEKVKALLREGKAMGCFYVESPAMRMLLKKLQVDDYLGLVAASSIIRPGVSKSGMMKEYVLRHRDPSKRLDAHPVMRSIMPETYGVMVYQEDVIKVAHYFAGLSLAEADVLRRGMSGKYRSREEFRKVEQKFFRNCRDKGYPDQLSAEVWRQISSFAGYAFAKGHSASYAVESYQSLFLKAHYPLEYMVGVINNFGGFYSTEIYIHEARMEGAQIHAPCINTSDYPTLIQGKDIFLGLMHLSGLENGVAVNILENRDSIGPFESLDDFMERLPELGIEQLSILIRINAFRFTGQPKRALLWEAHLRRNKEKPKPGTVPLFRAPRKQYLIPPLHADPLEEAFDQIELLGFPLCSPFELLAEIPVSNLMAKDLPAYHGKTIVVYGYLVTIKNTSTSGGDRMHFGTFLDQEGHFFDSVHFPPVAKRYPFRGKGVYAISGKVTEEFGFYCLEALELRKIDTIQDPRYHDKPHKPQLVS